MPSHFTRRDLLKYSAGALMLPASEASSHAAASSSALLLDPVYRQHDPGAGHPERPERYDAVTHALNDAGLTKLMSRIDVRSATEDEIAACHGRGYIQTVKREISAGAHELSTGDTSVGARTWDVALKAVGGVLNAVDAVVSRKAVNAFCAVRPPGHHARPEQGM